MRRDERVAIVGIGGIFPDAPDLAQFWANVEAGFASTRDVTTISGRFGLFKVSRSGRVP